MNLRAAGTGRPAAPVKPTPRFKDDPLFGNGGLDFEQVEHLVPDEDPDTALCGLDQTNVPWDQGWPLCEACRAIADGRMS
ncbi:MAG TPA: hypothetical protein VMV08_01865 [Gaiellaceae bacterium]|nr:hypothetical protein [Gaiellaceae bacterium]